MVSVSSCDVPRWYLYPLVMFLDGLYHPMMFPNGICILLLYVPRWYLYHPMMFLDGICILLLYVPRWYLYPQVMFLDGICILIPHVMCLDGICIRQCFTGTSVRDRNCDPIIGRIRLVRDSAKRFLLSFNENVESDSFYSLNRKNSDSFYSMKMWSRTLSIQ